MYLMSKPEIMPSQLKIIDLHIASTDRLLLEMGKRLRIVAGCEIKNKLATGEIKIVDGRYVDESLKVTRPLKKSCWSKKSQNELSQSG